MRTGRSDSCDLLPLGRSTRISYHRWVLNAKPRRLASFLFMDLKNLIHNEWSYKLMTCSTENLNRHGARIRSNQKNRNWAMWFVTWTVLYVFRNEYSKCSEGVLGQCETHLDSRQFSEGYIYSIGSDKHRDKQNERHRAHTSFINTWQAQTPVSSSPPLQLGTDKREH